MRPKGKDYYSILQVNPDAEQGVIEAAYRRLARKYDRSTSRKRKATLRKKEVDEAFQVLGDRKKRAEYDRLRATMRTVDTSGSFSKRSSGNLAQGSASRIFVRPYVWAAVGLAGVATIILALVFTGTLGGGGSSPASDTANELQALGKENELQALGEEWEKTVAKVNYDVTATSGSTTDKSTIILYRRPPDWRMDISGSQGDYIVIAAANAVYDCSAQSGTNQCVSYDPSQVNASALLGLLDPSVTAASLSGLNVDRSEQTISGESTACFSVTNTTGGTTSKAQWCFASDGILLQYTESSSDPASGNFTMQTIGVNRNVTDADFDFQPPYPVSTPVPAASPTPSAAPASPTPVQ